MSGRHPQTAVLSSEAREERAFRDRDAEGYEGHIPEYETLAEWATYSRLLGPPGVLAVDLGCGTGRFARNVASRFNRLVGIDFSLASLALARRRSPSTCIFVVADVLNVPLRSGCVDAVFSSQVLVHILASDQAGQYFSEVARVLRPGGRAVISTYALSLLDRLLFRKVDVEHIPRSVRWSWRELRHFCAAAGLHVRCLENLAVFSRSFAAPLRRHFTAAKLAGWDRWLSRIPVPWAALTVVAAERFTAPR